MYFSAEPKNTSNAAQIPLMGICFALQNRSIGQVVQDTDYSLLLPISTQAGLNPHFMAIFHE